MNCDSKKYLSKMEQDLFPTEWHGLFSTQIFNYVKQLDIVRDNIF